MIVKIGKAKWIGNNKKEKNHIWFSISVNNKMYWSHELLLTEGNLNERLINYKIFKKNIIVQTNFFIKMADVILRDNIDN